jgi:hypothetical protein
MVEYFCGDCSRGEALLASRETPRQEEELQWVRKFIEYARYELEPGEMQMGDQFPRQGDADKAIGILDRILGRETPQEPRQPEEGKWSAATGWFVRLSSLFAITVHSKPPRRRLAWAVCTSLMFVEAVERLARNY